MKTRNRLVLDLAAVPTQLAAAARSAPAAHSAATPPPGEWSVREVVCHLVAVEAAAWHVRLDSLWEAADEPHWIWTEPGPWTGPGSETLAGALEAFATRRAATMDRLARLDAAGWERTGIHQVFGRQDVAAVMATALDHDREHLAGFEQSPATGNV